MKKITFKALLFICLIGGWSATAQTFNYEGNTGAIPDNGCPDQTSFVATVTDIGTIGDTHLIDEILVNITHTWAQDIEMSLQAPNGVIVPLSISNGNGDDNYTNTVFTDEGNPPSITTGLPPFTGEWSPEGSLSDFLGSPGSGDWALLVCDNFAQDQGNVDQWSIRFQENPVACPSPFAVMASNVMSTSLDLSWSAVAAAGDYEYVLMATGTAPDPATAEATGLTGGATTVAITDLTAETSYDAYVRSICDGVAGEWSAVSVVATEATCPAPADLVVDSFTDVTVAFSWLAANNSTIYEWEVVPSGADAFDGNAVASGSTTELTATADMGLEEQTTYDIYVRNSCDTDGSSDATGPVSFTTACSVKEAPYSEDFTGASVNGDPECFEQEGDDYSYIYGTVFTDNAAADAVDHTDGEGNSDFAYVDASNFLTDTPGNTFLIVPEVSVADLEFPAIRFSVHSQLDEDAQAAGDVPNSLFVELDSGSGFTTIEALFQTTDTTDESLPGWEDFVIDLTEEEIDADVLRLRFNTSLIGSTPGENDILIDDISFDELGCIAPVDVDIDDIEFDNVTFDFDGYASATGGHTYVVVESGVDPAVGPIISQGDIAAGEEDGLAEGLSPITCYDLYVSANCSDDDSSDFSVVASFCTPGQCDEPDDVEVDDVTNTDATISWDEVDGVAGYEYVLTTVAGDPDDATTYLSDLATTTETTATVAVTPGTAFVAHVRSVCDPEGVSIWSSSDIAMTELGCGSDFFDTGGADGDYTGSESYCITIFPSTPLSAVTVAFSEVDLEFGEDFLAVYNGVGTAQPFSLDVQGPSQFVSTDVTGAITVCFESDTFGEAAGWVASVTCSLINDTCTGAAELLVDGTFDQSNIEASNLEAGDSGEDDPSCGFYGGGDVWFTAVVPESGSLTVETQETVTGAVDIIDTGVEVYTGSCGDLTSVGCDDNGGIAGFSLVSLTDLTPGDTVYIRVWGSDTGGLFGDFRISAYDESLGTNDLEAVGFDFFPNPVQTELTITAQERIENVEIFNILGQSVINTAPEALNARVDMSNLKSGMYLMNVTINGNTGAYRIIKQ